MDEVMLSEFMETCWSALLQSDFVVHDDQHHCTEEKGGHVPCAEVSVMLGQPLRRFAQPVVSTDPEDVEENPEELPIRRQGKLDHPQLAPAVSVRFQPHVTDYEPASPVQHTLPRHSPRGFSSPFQRSSPQHRSQLSVPSKWILSRTAAKSARKHGLSTKVVATGPRRAIFASTAKRSSAGAVAEILKEQKGRAQIARARATSFARARRREMVVRQLQHTSSLAEERSGDLDLARRRLRANQGRR